MKGRLNVKDYRYLIIAGTTKAATTSVFVYLSAHHQICQSNLKETCFFLDADYPVQTQKYCFEEGLDKYGNFFSHCEDKKLRMEASPHYLYSPGTPWKIKDSLSQVKIVFILREPISRLISWYRFAKQRGWLLTGIDFYTYVQNQLQSVNKSIARPPHMLSLEQGRYSIYLKPYFEVFSSKEICVVWYEDLKKNTKQAVQKICSFAGVDPTFFEDFEFRVVNPTLEMKSPTVHFWYRSSLRRMRNRIYNRSRLRKVLRFIRHLLEPIYLKLNAGSSEELLISPETRDFLENYYRHEADALAEMLNEPPPW